MGNRTDKMTIGNFPEAVPRFTQGLLTTIKRHEQGCRTCQSAPERNEPCGVGAELAGTVAALSMMIHNKETWAGEVDADGVPVSVRNFMTLANARGQELHQLGLIPGPEPQ